MNHVVSPIERKRAAAVEEALQRAHTMAAENDGELDIRKFARSYNIEMYPDGGEYTSEERPAVIRYDDTFEEFEILYNKHAGPEEKNHAIVQAITQFVLDKSVIIEAGVFPAPGTTGPSYQ